jgi:HEAT repeat protein
MGRAARPARPRTALLACAALAASSCGSDARRPIRPEHDLRDPSAARRTEAAAAVGGLADPSHVPVLIAMLDDEDPAVRLTASASLKRLTGHDTGYRASDPPETRLAHQASWRAWWASRTGAGAAAARGGPPGAAPPATGVPPPPPPPRRSAIPPPPGYTGGLPR